MLASFINIHPILTYIIIGIFIGISMMVAVVAVIIAFTNLMSPHRKSAIATKEKPAEKKPVGAPEKKPAPKNKSSVKPRFSFPRKKLAFARSRPSPQQKDVASDPPKVEQASPVAEIILNTANPEPEINATEFAVSLPLEELQPASEAVETVTPITDTTPVSMDESAQTQEEAEPPDPEEISTSDENEYHEEPAEKDDTFNLFTDDTAEESASNKFAADLNSVDVNDLLAEALKFRKQFR